MRPKFATIKQVWQNTEYISLITMVSAEFSDILNLSLVLPLYKKSDNSTQGITNL